MTPIAAAVDLALSLAETLPQVLGLIQTANAEGRTTLTDQEWSTLTAAADAAHARLTAVLGSRASPPAPGAPGS